MEKTRLVAGKDMPAGSKFAGGASFAGRSVMMTGVDVDVPAARAEDGGASAQQELPVAGIAAAEWNRASALSARTLILQTENKYDRLDEVVLYFDEEYFASIAGKTEIGECAQTCDNLILGYQFLTLETLARFEKKNAGGAVPGKLVFVL